MTFIWLCPSQGEDNGSQSVSRRGDAMCNCLLAAAAARFVGRWRRGGDGVGWLGEGEEEKETRRCATAALSKRLGIRGRCLLGSFVGAASRRQGTSSGRGRKRHGRTGCGTKGNLGAVGLGFWVRRVSRRESGVVVARPGTEGGVESKCLARPHLQLVPLNESNYGWCLVG